MWVFLLISGSRSAARDLHQYHQLTAQPGGTGLLAAGSGEGGQGLHVWSSGALTGDRNDPPQPPVSVHSRQYHVPTGAAHHPHQSGSLLEYTMELNKKMFSSVFPLKWLMYILTALKLPTVST